MNKIRFIFFGSSNFSVNVLDRLEGHNLSPVAVVTLPDKPKGRKLILTENPVKVWAKERNIKVIDSVEGIKADLFVVASYGKILPKELIFTPEHKTLNIHPSLLPRLRGPAPIQGAILEEKETGVTIIRLDEKMDHGPIIARESVSFDKWPDKYEVLEKRLAETGADLLVKILPDWLDGKIEEKPQEESGATFTKKIRKEDGLINFNEPAEVNLRKIYAYHIWPEAYFFFKRKDGREIRIIIKDAKIVNNEINFLRVVPEGKREMAWDEFLRGNK